MISVEERGPAAPSPVPEGTIFDEKYEVHGEIGRGGMGVVYLGEDLSLGRKVAIKVLPEYFNTDREQIERFKKEARAMATLDHPNVVSVYATGQHQNLHYFVMKFLEGHTLAEHLAQQRSANGDQPTGLPPDLVRSALIQVCGGLDHAHNRGLVHRDIKPGNLMLSDEGECTVMDFGIVKEATSKEALTREGLVFGTPEYMAPEQFQGLEKASRSTDIYSLGAVAYELLSGRLPFAADSPFGIALKQMNERPAPLVGEHPGISPAFEAIILRALALRPEDRFSSAKEMGQALEQLDMSWTPSAPPPSERKRHPSLAELSAQQALGLGAAPAFSAPPLGAVAPDPQVSLAPPGRPSLEAAPDFLSQPGLAPSLESAPDFLSQPSLAPPARPPSPAAPSWAPPPGFAQVAPPSLEPPPGFAQVAPPSLELPPGFVQVAPPSLEPPPGFAQVAPPSLEPPPGFAQVAPPSLEPPPGLAPQVHLAPPVAPSGGAPFVESLSALAEAPSAGHVDPPAATPPSAHRPLRSGAHEAIADSEDDLPSSAESSAPRPFIPIRQISGIASLDGQSPNLLGDRPGHYRHLLTAHSGAQARRGKLGWRWVAAIIIVVLLLVGGVIGLQLR